MSRPMTSVENATIFVAAFRTGTSTRQIVIGRDLFRAIIVSLGRLDTALARNEMLLGFFPVGDGPIAAWGQSISDMTHGCISGLRVHGPRWESKCGGDLRIQHGLNELVGSSYGRALAFYRRSSRVDGAFAAILEASMKEKTAKPILTVAQRRTLREQRSRIPAQVQVAFETALKAWKDTWFGGGLAISSDPHTRTVGREFDALVALGPEILPLVVEARRSGELPAFVLQLDDAIQPDPRLIVQDGPEDERILEGEHLGRVLRALQAWLTNR